LSALVFSVIFLRVLQAGFAKNKFHGLQFPAAAGAPTLFFPRGISFPPFFVYLVPVPFQKKALAQAIGFPFLC
jgi:hypothetical protein